MKNKNMSLQIRNLTLSAMFLAIGLVLPLLTGQIQQIGNKLLPMHLPVLLCGQICGWPYGLVIGFILPLLRAVTFGMPPLFPTATAMAFELATYGCVIGMLYGFSRWKCIVSLYRSMIIAMLAGRVVWGIVMMTLMGIGGNTFTWKAFMSSAVLNAIPGIILQLILIPSIMVALDKTKLITFTRSMSKHKSAAN